MKVFYQRAYRIGEFLQEKIAFEIEADINPILNPKIALSYVEELKLLCDEAHEKLNPGLYDDRGVGNKFDEMMGNPMDALEGISTIKKDPRQEAIQSHIKTIGECRTIQNLKIFENLVKNTNDPILTEAFNNKLKELQ